ncbi:MAG: YerC/YecD family TrpR-related protein [Bacillota bacterium]
MGKRAKKPYIDRLFSYILALESVEECHQFFDDICTVSELQAITQRMEVAELLDQGITYTEIAEKTGASTATISRVNRSLNYGTDGYKLLIDRMKENENQK